MRPSGAVRSASKARFIQLHVGAMEHRRGNSIGVMGWLSHNGNILVFRDTTKGVGRWVSLAS